MKNRNQPKDLYTTRRRFETIMYDKFVEANMYDDDKVEAIEAHAIAKKIENVYEDMDAYIEQEDYELTFSEAVEVLFENGCVVIRGEDFKEGVYIFSRDSVLYTKGKDSAPILFVLSRRDFEQKWKCLSTTEAWKLK